MKKIETLCKNLDLDSEYEYFDYIYESYINGQFTQVIELIEDMKKNDKKNALAYFLNNYENNKSLIEVIVNYI